jgi:hypothetical protein
MCGGRHWRWKAPPRCLRESTQASKLEMLACTKLLLSVIATLPLRGAFGAGSPSCFGLRDADFADPDVAIAHFVAVVLQLQRILRRLRNILGECTVHGRSHD